jgi:hypothetical protein
MTHKEFAIIKKEFEKEEKRWNELKIGQVVYEMSAVDSSDIFAIKIRQIDIKNRTILGFDRSSNKRQLVKFSIFYTKKELREIGIEVIK